MGLGEQARIVCGAANNQLLDPRDDCGMAAAGILYCPDFVVNRMGIVNCANEQYGAAQEQGYGQGRCTEQSGAWSGLGHDVEHRADRQTIAP